MLFTRCPNCQTTFRITADTLRVAHGAVRCGNCATVFSAFSGLRQDSLDPGTQADEHYLSPTLQTQELASIEDLESPELDDSPAASDRAAEPAATRSDVTAEVGPSPTPSLDDEPAAPVDDAQTGTPTLPTSGAEPVDEPPDECLDEPPDAQSPAVSAHAASDAQTDDSRTVTTTDALQFDVPADDAWSRLLAEIDDATAGEDAARPAAGAEERRHRGDAEASADAESDEGYRASFEIDGPDVLEQWDEIPSNPDDYAPAEARATEFSLDVDSDAHAGDADRAISAEEIDATLSAGPDPDVMTALDSSLGAGQANDKSARAWQAGAGIMALLLVGQLVHFNRALLATQPAVGRLVQTGYALLGLPLAPRWDLEQYEITNWAATAGETYNGIGNLHITAEIRNGGSAPQPYPNLRLELKDRWEAVVGRRVFSPREYLGEDFDTDRLMPAGQSVPAELAVVDPGLDASGFELDVCLAGGDETYRCSADRVFD